MLTDHESICFVPYKPHIQIQDQRMMDHGTRIANYFYEEALKIKMRTSLDKDELLSLLERSLDLLGSCTDYAAHLMATSNDFALLPNEIINDIVVDAADNKNVPNVKHTLESLLRMEGPWNQYAHNSLNHGCVLVYRNFRFCEALDSSKELRCEEAQNHSISHAYINEKADFEQLIAVAPNFYKTIEFEDVSDIPNNLLLRLGNRFSSNTWNQKAFKVNRDGKIVKSNIKPEVVDFLKRQLRSKHLRKLNVAADGFKQGELDKLLVDFVKRPSFQLLQSCGNYLLPFDLITKAYENWNSKTYFEVDQQQIFGSISEETYIKLREHFVGCAGANEIFKATRSHASLKSAKMVVYANVQRGVSFLRVTFSGMNVRDSDPDV